MGGGLWKRWLSWRQGAAARSRRFGSYHVVRVLHDGEKACVYEGRPPKGGEGVAIKAYKPLYNRTARRMRKRYGLRTEGEIGRLVAPSDAPEDFPVVRTFGEGWEFGDPSRCYYVVMEFVDGLNLKHLIGCADRWLAGHRPQVALAAARGLAAIHERGLVHRDVCTDNVVVRKDGRVKLIDLGFAAPEGIRFEEKSGTPSYMAPEQFDNKPLTAAADIYSFGVVLYELFTGRLPFVSRYSATNPDTVMRRTVELRDMHLREPPVPPREAAPGLPERLNDAILRCLEKLPADRFENMTRLCIELAQVDHAVQPDQDPRPI
jgi:serine/threonine-protein kinase